MGRILHLAHEDFEGLSCLAKKVIQELQRTGKLGPGQIQTKDKSETQTQLIDKLLIRSDNDLLEACVHGYVPGPEPRNPARELVGLVSEARLGVLKGDVDEAMIKEVNSSLSTANKV